MSIKKLITSKKSGQGDLIASIFVILALTMFVFLYINSIGAITTRTQLDEIGRRYILRMESSGELTSSEVESIKTECNKIDLVRKATGGSNNEIKVTWNNGAGQQSYGNTVSLVIECPVSTLNYGQTNKEATGKASILDILNKTNDKSDVKWYIIRKQSTAKY